MLTILNNLSVVFKRNQNKFHLYLIVGSVVYFISNILWGLEFTDGFFHINEAVQNEGYYPFETILSSQILFLLYKLFGIHLVLYRIFNSILFLLSYYLIYRTAKKHYNKVMLRLSTAAFIIITSPLNFNILGFDSISILSITLTIVYLLNNEINNIKAISILSLLIALSSLVRVPNILMLPMILIYFLHCKKSLAWKNSAIFKNYALLCALTLIIYLSYLLINYRSFSNILDSFASKGGHNISKILYHYYNDFFLAFKYLLVFIFIYVLTFFSKNTKGFLIFSITLLIFYYLYKSIYFVYHYHYAIIILSFITSIIIIYFIRSKEINYKLAFLFLSSLTICAGSNTGLIKMSFLSPIGLLCCLETSKFVSKQYIYIILGALIPFSFIILTSETFEDRGYFKLTKKINVPGLNPIYTSNDHYKTVHEILDITNQLEQKKYKVIFYGFHSHLFSFLRPAPREKYTFYQPFDDSKEMELILKKHKKNRLAIILINGNFTKKSNNNKTAVELLLTNYGFNEMIDDRLKIYTN